MWDAVARLAQEIRASEFMTENDPAPRHTRQRRRDGKRSIAQPVRVNALASAGSGGGVGRVHWHVVGIHLEKLSQMIILRLQNSIASNGVKTASKAL